MRFIPSTQRASSFVGCHEPDERGEANEQDDRQRDESKSHEPGTERGGLCHQRQSDHRARQDREEHLRARK
jgi:hypothetical protein